MGIDQLVERYRIIDRCVREEPANSRIRDKHNTLRCFLLGYLAKSDDSRLKYSGVLREIDQRLRELSALVKGTYYALTGRSLEPLTE